MGKHTKPMGKGEDFDAFQQEIDTEAAGRPVHPPVGGMNTLKEEEERKKRQKEFNKLKGKKTKGMHRRQ